MFLTILIILFHSICLPLAISFDPEVDMNITEVINYHGYPCINYDVVTSDGYILGIQRIPFGRELLNKYKINFRGFSWNRKHLEILATSVGNPPVLLQHGLLDSAHTWVNNQPNQSLAFILADQGYDVWLSNSRGNTYSRRHTSLNPDKEKFWHFSWDEMAEFDLPAVVDHVLAETGYQSLAYVGHSQGTMIAFAQLNSDAHLRGQLSVFVALGPVTLLDHIVSPIKYAAPFTAEIQAAAILLGHGEFLPATWLSNFLAKILCGHDISEPVCSNIIFLLCGYDKANMNDTRVPVYVAHTPAGTSTQNVVHYSQTIQQKAFQKFDFGAKGNQEHYGQKTPPRYGLGNISVPVALFYGDDDWLADPDDSLWTANQLPRLVKLREVANYNHLDFVWGIDAHEVVYPDILDTLRQFPPQRAP